MPFVKAEDQAAVEAADDAVEAAVRVQARARGHAVMKAKKAVEEKEAAAAGLLQKSIRGQQARVEVKKIKQERAEKEVAAASIMQARQRGKAQSGR